MKRKSLLKIILVLILSAGLGVGIYFLGRHYFVGPKKGPQKKINPSRIQRKLAYSSDPSQLLEKARDAEVRGNWQEAIGWYNILIRNLPGNDLRKGYAYYRRAFCFFKTQDYQRAKESLEFGLNHFPDMPQVDEALFLMAEIYQNLGELDKADKTYNTIIKMFPSRAEEAKKRQSQLQHPSKTEP